MNSVAGRRAAPMLLSAPKRFTARDTGSMTSDRETL